MQKEEKVNCGSGRKRSDTWLSVTINPEVIKPYIEEMNGKKYVKLNINIGKPNQYGKDVSITVDTWRPDGQVAKKVEQNNAPAPISEDGDAPW